MIEDTEEKVEIYQKGVQITVALDKDKILAKYIMKSSDGRRAYEILQYNLNKDPNYQWSCQCKGWIFNKKCRHTTVVSLAVLADTIDDKDSEVIRIAITSDLGSFKSIEKEVKKLPRLSRIRLL